MEVEMSITTPKMVTLVRFNPLNAELNPIRHLLALLDGTTTVDVSRLRVNFLPPNRLI
jgi:hypothetical protein